MDNKELDVDIALEVINVKIAQFIRDHKNYSREEATEIITNKSGKVTNSVTKKTSVVIVGENPGSKYNKALELNIEIWTEEDFTKKVNDL